LTFIEDTADEFLEEKSLAVAKDSVLTQHKNVTLFAI